MKERLLVALFLVLMVSGCRTKADGFEFEAEKSALVLWAELPYGAPARVMVSASILNPFSPNHKSPVIDNLVVELYKNGELSDTLVVGEEGFLESQSIIDVDNSYHIEAGADNFERVVSEQIMAAPIIEDLVTDLTKQDNGALGCGGGLVTHFEITWPFPTHQATYYELYLDGHCATFDFGDGNLDCIFQAAANRTKYLSSECFQQSTAQIKSSILGDHGNFTIRSISASRLRYEKSLIDPDAFSQGFAEPRPTYSNVHNGFGIIFSSRTYEFEF